MKIAISGKMLAGKDFIAAKLIKKYKFERRAFADALKNDLLKIFNVTKENHINAREILQLYGKVGRIVDPLWWVNKALENIDNKDIVVTDLRFKNEANELKKRGFHIVRIRSSRETRAFRGTLSNENDISETDMDDYKFDYNLENENTTTERNLNDQIEGMVAWFNQIENGN